MYSQQVNWSLLNRVYTSRSTQHADSRIPRRRAHVCQWQEQHHAHFCISPGHCRLPKGVRSLYYICRPHQVNAQQLTVLSRFPGVCLFSEIYQVTGPVARFARQIAGQGYIVAAPSSYHDFVGPEPLKYDVEDTDRGNKFKIEKTLESYDADSHATVDYLLSLPTCTGLIGSTGMCLGGHLAVRAALDPRITACVSYFATDIHSRTLGPYTAANSSPSAPANSNHTIDHLSRLGGEVAMIFGIKDTHVPDQGRDLIRSKLRDAGCVFSFHEFAWAQHAFIRDELSKGRYDPAVTKICFEILLELFGRVLKTDLGQKDGNVAPPEHVC